MSGQPSAVDVRAMTNQDRLEDALFTGLRLTDGIDIDSIGRRYGIDVWARYGSELQPFIQSGVLSLEDARLRLTRTGMLVANEVMQVFV